MHYGVTMGDGATLAANSFLMKGEDVPRYARWGGNPARELSGSRPALPAQATSVVGPARRRVPVLLAALIIALLAADAVLISARESQTAVPALCSEQLPAAPSTTTGPAEPAPDMPSEPAVVPAEPAPVPDLVWIAAGAGPAATPFRLADLPLLDGGLRAGSEAVATLQQQLAALGFDPGTAHGRFDQPAAAVRTSRRTRESRPIRAGRWVGPRPWRCSPPVRAPRSLPARTWTGCSTH